MNDEQVYRMLSSMTNFFRDYIPENDQLSKLIKIYGSTFEYVWTNAEEAADNDSILTTRTLQTIPYFKLNVRSALYPVHEVRFLEKLTFKDQISYLTRSGYYADLTFDQSFGQRTPNVYYFDLYESFNSQNSLLMYEDYFIWLNKLYLLPKYVKSRSRALDHLHAFNIKINDYALENNHGNNFDLQVGPLLKRHDYRDSIEAYMRTLSSNLTIKDIKKSLRAATKWEEFNIEDHKSPTLSEEKKRLYQNWLISPHEFIVTLPEFLIADKAKTNFLHLFLHEVKESQTNYFIFYELNRIDAPTSADVFKKGISFSAIDATESDDRLSKLGFSANVQDYLDISGPLILRYDRTLIFDSLYRYDNKEVTDTEGFLDDDFLVIEHTFPEIPRSFLYEGGTFKCRPNDDGTSSFELLASEYREGPYKKIEMKNNDENLSEVEFNHDATTDENRYYKMRAWGDGVSSLPTLPIEIF